MADECRRVLVVDDDEGILELTCEAIRLQGYEVRDATCLADVKEVVERWEPHVAVIDLMMLPYDGTGVASYLRNRFPCVRILMYSAKVDLNAVKAHVSTLKIDVFMQKPFDLEDLYANVKKLCDLRGTL